MTPTDLIAQAEAALDVIHRLSQAQGYDGDAVGCALCTDADAAIWHNDEPICQDCANRIMERAYESAGVSALIARIRELEGANTQFWNANLRLQRERDEANKLAVRATGVAEKADARRIAAEATLTAQVEAMRGERDALREALFVYGDRAKMGGTLQAAMDAYGAANPARHVDTLTATLTTENQTNE